MSYIKGCGVFLFILFFTTANCSPTKVKWYKPGATATSFSQDKAACEQALLGVGDSGMPKQVYTFEGCMERKGWQPLSPSQQ